ncbi:MAG: translocation/assembly module TamB domain-containing protein [Bacteroidales bacterium]|nr:translocation/assembly module TamB domain-containing protein [Bacteroidales bacterium]
MTIALVIILLPTGLYLSLRSNKVQNYLGEKIFNSLSKKTEHNFSFRKLKIGLFTKVVVYDLLINDQSHDTLFFMPKVQVNLRQFNRQDRILHFSKVYIDNACIKFHEDSLQVLNITTFLNSLKKDKADTTKKKWNLYISNLQINNSSFEIKKYKSEEKAGLNFSDLQLHDFNLKAKGFQMEEDSISMFINALSFADKSGFTLDNFSAYTGVSQYGICFQKGVLMTPEHTMLSFEDISLLFSNFKDLSKGNFSKNVKIKTLFNPSSISYTDLWYFSDKIPRKQDLVTFSGNIYGRLNSLKLRDMAITMGTHTTFKGKIDMDGLPDAKNTFLFIDIDHFATTMADINTILLQNKPGHSELPPTLYESGLIQYKGKFTGFIDDFVSYGVVFTDLGIISTDLLIKPDTARYVGFKGSIKAFNFDIGAFTGRTDKLGKISLVANIKGSSSQENKIYADLNGKIMKFELLGYAYKNMELNGKISDKFFDGSFTIDDPNLQFDFTGNMDFSNNIPVFNFNAQLEHANLYQMHLIDDDSLYNISCNITADFKGFDIDELDGKITLLNSTFTKTGKTLEIDKLSILARHTDKKDRLDIFSDFFTGYISGEYDFSKISQAVYKFKSNYLSSLIKEKIQLPDTIYNKFNYYFEMGETQALCEFFFPSFCISKGSLIYGNICPFEDEFNLTCFSPELTTANKPWTNFQLSIISSDSVFSINAGCENFQIAQNLKLENFTLISDVINNNIYFNARWNNWDSLLNKGNIIASAKINSSIISSKPKIDFYLQPSEIIYGTTKWQIHESSIKYDSAFLAVNNIKLTNEERELIIKGQLSGKREDLLYIDIHNFNMASINIFTEPKGLLFSGNLNGTATISEIFTNPIIDSDFLIDTLSLNKEKFGETIVHTKWDNTLKQIGINTQIKRGNINTIEINGNLVPETKIMAFNIHLDKLKMNLLTPYLSSTFSNINGVASGDLLLTGTTHKPQLNGSLVLQKAALTINYLKTDYYFADVITIENNNLLFNNIELHDHQGNKATLNGSITTKYLKDIGLNLTLAAKSFCMLHTTAYDNSQFYGNAYATGNIKITGPSQNIHITAQIKTERNTEFSIPLSSENEIYENDFISWRSSKDTLNKQQSPKKYEVNASGITLDFEIELTPDAEAQLIFDPKVGDVIKSRGAGNINLNINTLGKFQMYGDYKIEEGDYLFTLENVINKKFKVERGGTIIWNGDPSDADIDIAAVYKLKTSVAPILNKANTEQVSRRVNVECRTYLTNKLQNPTINLDIAIPGADEETRTALKRITSNEEDKNKQFLSLLVLNSFYVPQDNLNTTNTNQTSSTSSSKVAGVTTSELLSNQLSHWLSQISNDFDIGVNYRPGDEITSDEVEFALSTQLLNDRVSINGNLDVDMGNAQQDPSNQNTTSTAATNDIMGDFDVDVKITKSGKLRVKAFNRANDRMLVEKSPYTQGVGLFYREEFDSFGELISDYWSRIFKGEKNSSN